MKKQIKRDEGNEYAADECLPGSPSREARVPQRRGIKRVRFSYFRRDLRDARNRLASIPTTIHKSQYGDIEYRAIGRGQTVLVSHGITGGVDQAEYLVTRWRNLDARYRFVYLSRFGYLKSSLPDAATPRLQAAAYKDLLDHLGTEQVFVVGNSAGGASALWFAIDYPERTNGLILISSAVPGPEPDAIPKLVREHDFIYWAAVKLAPDMLIGLLLPKGVHATLTDEDKHFIVANAYMAALPISERSDGIAFDSEQSNPGINDVPFEEVTTPTLIFQAIDDPRELRGGREMKRRIPHSEFIGLTGGHFLLHHETEIRAATAEFIAKHETKGR